MADPKLLRIRFKGLIFLCFWVNRGLMISELLTVCHESMDERPNDFNGLKSQKQVVSSPRFQLILVLAIVKCDWDWDLPFL